MYVLTQQAIHTPSNVLKIHIHILRKKRYKDNNIPVENPHSGCVGELYILPSPALVDDARAMGGMVPYVYEYCRYVITDTELVEEFVRTTHILTACVCACVCVCVCVLCACAGFFLFFLYT